MACADPGTGRANSMPTLAKPVRVKAVIAASTARRVKSGEVDMVFFSSRVHLYFEVITEPDCHGYNGQRRVYVAGVWKDR